jgi:hypothetical protein
LQGDLVLQNGEKIVTVELGFPFFKTFNVSAAGWTRAKIGWEGGCISISNSVEIGVEMPSVPGLTQIMQYFIKTYGAESTEQCSSALALAADQALEEEGQLEVHETPDREPLEQESNASVDAGGPGDDGGEQEREATVEAEEAVLGPESTFNGTQDGESTGPGEEEGAESEQESDTSEWQDPPKPPVPGLDESNLVVRCDIDPKLAEAMVTKEAGVARLMSKKGGEILATMAQDGWEVTPVDIAKGIFELALPSVRYEVPGGTVVSIPAPRFLTTVYDSNQRTDEMDERLIGDLVLTNGADILKVEVGFPFYKTFAVSAAGWARSRVGSKDGQVSISNFVEIGMQVPKIPGVTQVMQFFVKSYGNDSTQQCAEGLAKGADILTSDAS